MTEITYSMENGRYTLEAKGHAGYDKHGHDIFSAAVCARYEMVWAGMERECYAKGEQKQKEWELLFDCVMSDENRNEADALMKSVIE